MRVPFLLNFFIIRKMYKNKIHVNKVRKNKVREIKEGSISMRTMRIRKLKKLMRYIKDTIKETLLYGSIMIGLPFLMFIYWLAFGY
jgi:hypothetical protein